jgi:hypothetical protein
MATTLGEILETLQKVASAPEATPATLAPAPAENQVSNEDAELRKIAEEYDAAGRIMARGFTDELQKIAVGATGITPNTAAIPENPAVQVTDGYVQLPEVDAVVNTLRQMTQGAEARFSSEGKVEVAPHTTMPTGASVSSDPKGLAADAAKAQEAAVAERVTHSEAAAVHGEKKASAAVEILYRSFFGN